MTQEGWKDVIGYEGIYRISTDGRLYSIRTDKFIKPQKHTMGYLRFGFFINSKSKNLFIHRLVAEAFIPNPNNFPQVNHKNGIKTDNRVENLEWCSAKHNLNHAVSIGLAHKAHGQTHYKAKLKETDIPTIKQLYESGASIPDLGRRYGVAANSIRKIVTLRTWKHLI